MPIYILVYGSGQESIFSHIVQQMVIGECAATMINIRKKKLNSEKFYFAGCAQMHGKTNDTITSLYRTPLDSWETARRDAIDMLESRSMVHRKQKGIPRGFYWSNLLMVYTLFTNSNSWCNLKCGYAMVFVESNRSVIVMF